MSASPTPDFPQHVVTAVLVSHDGERWLPDVLAGLRGQDRPVQDVIAADTGSADRSATLVTEAVGAERVLHLARRTGFGAAVAEAARTAPVLTPDDLPYLRRPSGWDPVTRSWHDDAYDMPELPHGEPVHWLWLLHDDSAPEPGALAALLREADADPSATVIGAKLRGWYDRRQLLETGVSIAHSGRRWTGLERREQDQGQHDGVRPVLAVSTAGMLVRRDVLDELGGFDRGLPLMRDDIDFCWRAHAAGHRVLIVPSAVLRHAEAASRERRAIDCAGRLGGSPHRVDKAAAAYALLVNSRFRVLPWVLLRLLFGTVLRVLGYLVGKMPGRALDEVAGLLTTLLRPGRIIRGRRVRRRSAAPGTDPAALRPLFPPPGATLKATVDQAASALAARRGDSSGSSGRHGGAVESGPADDDADALEVEQFTRVRQFARRPGPLLFLVLLTAALLACRELIGGGALAGGALLAAPGDAADLWARYLDGWQPLGTGGTQSAPPYLAFLAMAASALLGETGLAMTALVLCAVPLAGAAAYFSSRPLLPSRLLRAWAAVAYAFLPAVTGALAAGRIGTLVLAVLLPPLARCAVSALGAFGATAGSWRAAWAGALLLTVATAFTPVVWPLALTLGVLALLVPRNPAPRVRKARVARLAALLCTPLVLLAPWSWTVLTDPDRFLAEAGLPYATEAATAVQLLGLDPGGPGTPGSWLLLGLPAAALAALLRRDRRRALATAWAAALVALAFAVWTNANGATYWAGPAVLVYGAALLAAAATGADGAKGRVAAESFGWRQPLAVLIAASAALGTTLAALGWVVRGADGPLERVDPVQVPAFVAEESSHNDRARTLVLAAEGTSADGASFALRHTLLRGAGARLGDADLAALMPEDENLGQAVAALAAGTGADQTVSLSGYAIRYVLVQDGSPRELHDALDATPGLQRLSQENGVALWRVSRETARVMVLPPAEDATAEPRRVPAGAVEVDTELPDGPAGRTLRLADSVDPGWHATLGGEPLSPVTVDGWAQGFELPAGGGRLVVGYETGTPRTLWAWGQGFLLLVLVVLALPGRRRELDDDLPEPDGRRAPGPRPEPEPEPVAFPAQAVAEPDPGTAWSGHGYESGAYPGGAHGDGYGYAGSADAYAPGDPYAPAADSHGYRQEYPDPYRDPGTYDPGSYGNGTYDDGSGRR